MLLLHDIRTVFNNRGADRLSTEVLLTDLKGIEESPWAVIRQGEPLDARGLSQRLRKYDIKPDLQRIGDEVLRGYTRAQFADAWSRYLHTESVTSVTEVTFTAGRSAPSDLCEMCERAPARADTGVCDFCTVKRHRPSAIPLKAGMSIGMMLISVELLIMLCILLFIPGELCGPVLHRFRDR